ncbi:MAG: HindVP family restriction endonuclease [Glaciimonas sp.]|nr:HindVP family restriction endonuclease [Glaciimonas sp.]
MPPNEPPLADPSLYGIHQSNRATNDLWGKNQFNSTFPTALACYMRDRDINPVYLTVDENLHVVASEITVGELFNSTRPNRDLRFEFESKFDPYQQYAINDIGGIDLVVKHGDDRSPAQWRRALEVKLTVLPDNTTCNLDESEWSSELVVRPASTKYCALGIIDSSFARRADVRDIFEGVCGTFQHWDSMHEVVAKRADLLAALNLFQTTFRNTQKPFLMQPIWKTQGKAPTLSENAFDIFIWSDFALCRTFLDKSLEGIPNQVNRYMRSSARLARVLYELSRSGRANINSIYTEMAFDLQTDKEFALPGQSTKFYLNSPRRITPALTKDVIVDVILNGGQRMLSPERRFDACVYFTADIIFEVRAQQALAREAQLDLLTELGMTDQPTVVEIVSHTIDQNVGADIAEDI